MDSFEIQNPKHMDLEMGIKEFEYENENNAVTSNTEPLLSTSFLKENSTSAADSAYGESPQGKWETLDIPEPGFNDTWRFTITANDISSSPDVAQNALNNPSPSMYKKHLLVETKGITSSTTLMSPWQVYQPGESILFSAAADETGAGYDANSTMSPFEQLSSPFEYPNTASIFSGASNPFRVSSDFQPKDFAASPLTIGIQSPFLDSHSSKKSSFSSISMSSPLESPFSISATTIPSEASPINVNNNTLEYVEHTQVSQPVIKKRRSSVGTKPKRHHKDGKIFPCDLCSSTFSRNHDLKRHVRIHLGILPYKCDTCPKSFTRMDALSRHKNIRGCKGAEND